MKDRNLIDELRVYSIILSKLDTRSEEFHFVLEKMKDIISVYNFNTVKEQEQKEEENVTSEHFFLPNLNDIDDLEVVNSEDFLI